MASWSRCDGLLVTGMTDADPAAAGSRGISLAPSSQRGLDAAAVSARVAAGQVNVSGARPSRSFAEILRANLLTRFNAILGALLVVVGFVGPLQDGLFGVVLIVNAAIGIIQELRAKQALDRLAVLSAPHAHALRDGEVVELPSEQVVLDEVVALRPGDQLVADGCVLESDGLELDESFVSGEFEPVDKAIGAEVLSGSFVVAGSGLVHVVRVGSDAYAQRLQIEAKRFAATYSELQRGTNRILQVISWLILPVAALLVTSQLLRSGATLDEALRGVVAGIAAMVPEGLVLLTTIAFAAGALRLANRRVLVQSLPAIEGLARVDVLCIDKTGTLTAPGMTVTGVEALGNEPPEAVLGALAATDPAPNATMRAIAAAYDPPTGWSAVRTIPFSSERKWSAAEFAGRGSYVLGAPSFVLSQASSSETNEWEEQARRGRRVLLLARSPDALDGERLPAQLHAVGRVLLAERIRPDAEETVAYLREQGVDIKVLSGDDAGTVASVAARVGIPFADAACDASELAENGDELAKAVARCGVFGRVRPAQKRAIVEALQAAGHVVAMTGDGVNDVPALKQADVGIAMGSGSQASRAVANIVLLDSDFAAVPPIVAEGRRVIANIERVASLFLAKTTYALLIALAVGILAVPYPFYPRQLTVVSSLTIGIPGFFLALAPGAPRAQPHFLARVLRFSVPAGIGAGVAVLAVYGITGWVQHAPLAAAKTAGVVALFLVASFVLAFVARPLDRWRLALVLSMIALGALAATVPLSRRVFALAIPPWSLLVTVIAVVVPIVIALVVVLRRSSS